MNEFKKLRKLFLYSTLLSLMIGCKIKQAQTTTEAPNKPNVLFILVDDYGYKDTGVSGSNYYETPNIDFIANTGMQFSDGYATCQVCSPSRGSIMSGQFPARHGITDWIGAPTGKDWKKKSGRENILLPPEYEHQLDTAITTLPKAMKEAGYKTFFAGKWHLGDEGFSPENHGFDINKGGYHAGGPRGGYFSPFKNPKLENRQYGENLSMRLAQETADFMKAHKDTTFFAYLSFYAVHGPIQTTQEKWSKYREKAVQLGVKDKGYEMGHFLPMRLNQDNPVYAGLVEQMDDAVGVVLKSLKDNGLDKNTIVIFTSDNGGVVAGDAFSTNNYPLRGGKGYQYEGGIREPYFIKVPWVENNGKVSEIPVTGTDFYPTILDLVGADLKPETHADGVSLKPILMGEEWTLGDRPLVWHYPHYGNQGGEPSSVIRLGDWKYIHYYESEKVELFNLRADISESENVADQHPEIVNNLHKKLFDYLQEVGARFPTVDPDFKASRAEKQLKKMKEVKMKNLEKERMKMLSEDFKPNADWWGSKVTLD
ncbi:sulfatase-like hydrolase/transferase [Flammeovirga yaeyamensis]|uniref:Sulfatase-like hydrolase/transferase n=1 Tax=Flammeovirga yaeyamensis TaxID=367791 RepID=A0AAX1NBA2_9BACT|nr:sulfatase [Flammeovirga yaeyamensis]MBB3699864.1 arylsulfatase A-like enzyme [Flammeovirga yaeyamensis]NMF38339.1 sulfatase [Flammeovirga yaeyamensis]QWG04750.1 sulfatase-like hydrolase/transferase [Flammeovirga yaeyamensis]